VYLDTFQESRYAIAVQRCPLNLVKISDFDISGFVPEFGQPGNPFWQLATQAKKAACELWKNYPKEFTGGNPGNAPVRYMWNAFCQAPPINQPPELPIPPPFEGGQCCDKTYQVSYEYTARRCYQNRLIDSGVGVASIAGKVKWIGFRNAPPGFNANGLFLEYEDCDLNIHWAGLWGTNVGVVDFNCNTENVFDPNSDAINGVLSSAFITGIVTNDGSDDVCGSLPPSYPNNPPPSEINYTFNISEGDHHTDIDFKVAPKFYMPIVFKGIDVNLHLDFGGVTFEWHGPKEKPGGEKNPFPTKPPTTKPPNGDDGGGGGENPKPGDPDLKEEEPKTADEVHPVIEKDPNGGQIVWVLIEITSIFENEKYHIEYQNSDDDVYFAGHICWINEQAGDWNSSPEYPIRRKTTILKKPPEYSGYKVRAINGATLVVKSYTQYV
jgi:hypothetical protein